MASDRSQSIRQEYLKQFKEAWDKALENAIPYHTPIAGEQLEANRGPNQGEIWQDAQEGSECQECGAHEVEVTGVNTEEVLFKCSECGDEDAMDHGNWAMTMARKMPDLEIRNGKHKCYCDYDTVIRVVGCQCGGW